MFPGFFVFATVVVDMIPSSYFRGLSGNLPGRFGVDGSVPLFVHDGIRSREMTAKTSVTVLSSCYFDDVESDRVARAVEALGGTYLRSPEERDARVRLIDRHIAHADVFLGGRLTSEQFRRASNLRWIHVPWAGVNSLLGVEEIRSSAIPVTNSTGAMSDSVADQVIWYIISLARSLHRQVRAAQQREWLRYPTESAARQVLRGRTIGLVGYGEIGRAVAVRARAFGMRVVVVRRHVGEVPDEVDSVYGERELGRLLEESDAVVLAVPLTDRTRGMIGREAFRRMKRSAWIVNISRGAVIDESEMIEALRAGEIAGAGLDVFEKEPLPEDSPLWEMENVIVTPHSAGGFMGFGRAVADIFLENLRRFVEGQPLLKQVRKDIGY